MKMIEKRGMNQRTNSKDQSPQFLVGGFQNDGMQKLAYFLDRIRRNCTYFGGFWKQEYWRTRKFFSMIDI